MLLFHCRTALSKVEGPGHETEGDETAALDEIVADTDGIEVVMLDDEPERTEDTEEEPVGRTGIGDV